MSLSERPEVGATVLVEQGSGLNRSEAWAKVTKVTDKGTITVRLDSCDIEETIRRRQDLYGADVWRGLRMPRPEELAFRSWMSLRPRTKLVTASTGLSRSSFPDVVISMTSLNAKGYGDEMRVEQVERVRQASAELAAIADWLANRP